MIPKKLSNLEKAKKFILDCTDPFYFINAMWGLVPQPTNINIDLSIVPVEEWKVEMFQPFIKGKHITWQQCAIIQSIKESVEKKGANEISVKSGNGIGKSCTLSWLILWFLFRFYNAKVPCTAPTTSQMHDVLWSELSVWINKMPEMYKDLFDWTADYVRIKESPESWFARARTARKENPEAFSGIHSDNVLLIADEASGVDDSIFEFGKGATTGKFWIMLMFSNPTRLVGKFKRSFDQGSGWRNLSFSSIDSPVVSPEFIEGKKRDSGIESDDYNIFVLGNFPRSDSVDDSGYVPLIIPEVLNNAMCDDIQTKYEFLGIDPSGEGNDKTSFVTRNQFFAKIQAEEQISTPKSIAIKGNTIAEMCGINPTQIVIDNMGSGANVSLEFAQLGKITTPLNVKDKDAILETENFLNNRAKACWEMKEWIQKGGMLIRDKRWQELLNLRYRYNEGGKLQIMPKEQMRKKGIPSPNFADALMLTFLAPEIQVKPSRPKNFDIMAMRRKLQM